MSLVFYTTPLSGFQPTQARTWVPVDIRETEDELIFKADIPGVEMKDIEVQIENGDLTIRGARAMATDGNDGGWHRVERSYGAFERVFTLPETVDVEHVKADYKNGTLTVTLPKKELAKPRQIKVEFSNQRKRVSFPPATSSNEVAAFF